MKTIVYSFFAFVSRMKYISRWSLMRNSERENVQEHSHMTAVIAHALAVIRRDVFSLPADPGLAAAAALFHDASEIFTGDLPTPVKYFNSMISSAYKNVEHAAEQKLLDTLPDKLQNTYRSLLLETGGEDNARLVKAADTLSAYIKCLEELKSGNIEFRMAADQTLSKLRGYGMSEVDYFIENFIPAFELSLDELDFMPAGN